MWLERFAVTLMLIVVGMQIISFLLCPEWRDHSHYKKLAKDTGGRWNCPKCGKIFGECGRLHNQLERAARLEGVVRVCENCSEEFRPDIEDEETTNPTLPLKGVI